jgi:hypothetical protein
MFAGAIDEIANVLLAIASMVGSAGSAVSRPMLQPRSGMTSPAALESRTITDSSTRVGGHGSCAGTWQRAGGTIRRVYLGWERRSVAADDSCYTALKAGLSRPNAPDPGRPGTEWHADIVSYEPAAPAVATKRHAGDPAAAGHRSVAIFRVRPSARPQLCSAA